MFNTDGINNLSELDEDDDNAITIVTKGSRYKSSKKNVELDKSSRKDYIDDDFDLLDQTLPDNEEAVINESIIENNESKKQTENVVEAYDESEKEEHILEFHEKSKNFIRNSNHKKTKKNVENRKDEKFDLTKKAKLIVPDESEQQIKRKSSPFKKQTRNSERKRANRTVSNSETNDSMDNMPLSSKKSLKMSVIKHSAFQESDTKESSPSEIPPTQVISPKKKSLSKSAMKHSTPLNSDTKVSSPSELPSNKNTLARKRCETWNSKRKVANRSVSMCETDDSTDSMDDLPVSSKKNSKKSLKMSVIKHSAFQESDTKESSPSEIPPTQVISPKKKRLTTAKPKSSSFFSDSDSKENDLFGIPKK